MVGGGSGGGGGENQESSTTTTTSTHVLLVSFPGQGHLNPLLRLAKKIAAKGLLVTFSTTFDVRHRMLNASSSATNTTNPDSIIPVGLGSIRFEFFPDGIDPDDPRRADINYFMKQFKTSGYPAVADIIRRQAADGRPVSCVINNPFVPWAIDIASEMNIPSAVLWVQSCAVFSAYYHYHHRLAEFPSADNPDAHVILPGLPPMKPDDLPTFLLPSNPYPSLTEVILEQFNNLSKASWILVNSFSELERDAIQAVCDNYTPLIPVGPLVDGAGEPESEITGDLWKAVDCLDWLDDQEPKSAVYVSVGSIVNLSKEDVEEMADGLKESGRPFVWVLRENFRSLLPEGFLEVTEGRGVVVGWAPQERVLGHVAVGCFVTHCGWNSTLEAVAAGVAVVAFPHWGDQVPNAKFLVEVWGVGVRMRSPVERGELVRCVEEVMAGEGAEEMRRRAAGWKEAAMVAVAKGGSSDLNIGEFVDEVRRSCGGGGGREKVEVGSVGR